MRVLLVGPPAELPDGIDKLLADKDWTVESAPDLNTAKDKVRSAAVDAVVLGRSKEPSPDLEGFLRSVASRHIAAVLVGADPGGLRPDDEVGIDLAGADITKEELSWRLSTLTRFQNQVRRMDRELEHMQKLGHRLNRHFRELDDEMRLASRLQHDFLPRDVASVGPLRFSTIYRPASWVSGDIFDIRRIGDRHVGFYIADAVGHGVAAGLLTMFIKRSMVTQRTHGGKLEIVEPGEALRMLNDALAQYTLPNCQFVTGVHCIVDLETLEMRYARGGHPHPIRINAEGEAEELRSLGSLMGLFEGMECPTSRVQLHPGDKVILFTDGVEAAFDQASPGSPPSYRSIFQSLADGTGAELVARLEEDLDRQDGSLMPADDVTVLVAEVQSDGA